ncbi:MAG TPA: hypothetical protein VMR50_13400 [Myxococcota bacterium]|nr:hypothetical protein [Myxococcota bacterium]
MQIGKWLVLGSLLTLCGCASGPEPTHVQEYGDKYFVNYQSMFGAGTALEASVKDANAFCDAKGLRMAPVSSDRGMLIFRCVPENQLSEVSAPPKR